jgi:CAAX amino terminal protease family protein
MKENIVIKYRHTALSYLLSTLIFWAFWLAASYVSYHMVYSQSTWTTPLLGLTGLYFQMTLTIMLVLRN